MSHLKERKEKNCLNCNAEVHGKYCHICGQENIESKESALHLVNHFFQDITHFDGKFFSTVKLLITRPGFLSREYMAGRRASYLNPIRMYIFTSAFFFLVFFSITDFDIIKVNVKKPVKAVMEKLKKNEKNTVETLAETEDSFTVRTLRRHLQNIRADIDTLTKDTTAVNRLVSTKNADFNIGTGNYKTVSEYDSVQKAMPDKEKDGWLGRMFMRQALAVKEKYKDYSVQNVLMSKFFHMFPQILFLSLPLFALLLKLLYVRRKQFYYVNHGIFSIHFYIFCFITLLAIIGISELEEWLKWRWLFIVNVIFSIGILFYLYKAMRNFYQQRRAKTIFKFLILCFMAMILLVLLFSIFFVFSFFRI